MISGGPPFSILLGLTSPLENKGLSGYILTSILEVTFYFLGVYYAEAAKLS
jgi:hypothetical protein